MSLSFALPHWLKASWKYGMSVGFLGQSYPDFFVAVLVHGSSHSELTSFDVSAERCRLFCQLWKFCQVSLKPATITIQTIYFPPFSFLWMWKFLLTLLLFWLTDVPPRFTKSKFSLMFLFSLFFRILLCLYTRSIKMWFLNIFSKALSESIREPL